MKLKGLAVSEGIGIGQIFRYVPFQPRIEKLPLTADVIFAELNRYQESKQRAQIELEELRNNLQNESPEKAAIFGAQLDILFDVTMEEDICSSIKQEQVCCEWAIQQTYKQYAEILAAVDDPLIQERAADMNDVCLRLLRCSFGEQDTGWSSLKQPSIILAHDLLPSDTASLNRKLTLGIITEVGGATSHSAIIARGYEIPAVLGVSDALAKIPTDTNVVLDAIEGEIIINPTQCEIDKYTQKLHDFNCDKNLLKTFLNEEPVMRDGAFIEVDLNISSSSKEELASEAYTNGVGLFRTEFLFMQGNRLPSEEEQVEAYHRVFEVYKNRPVIIRTLDIGGDKQAEALHLPPEDNPFLGNRALRLCFNRPELFRTQIRACLRAGVGHNLWLMFPMVGSMDDIRAAKQAVNDAKKELNQEGISFSENCKIGIMIEIPSIALMAAEAAEEVDFASIGTNDLTQYLLAVDRMNPAVSSYYQMFHPAVFRLISHVASEFSKRKKPISVCGELGGNRLAIPVLLGLGIHKLSMGASSLAVAKKIIRGLTQEEAFSIANHVCRLSNAEQCEQFLQQESQKLLYS